MKRNVALLLAGVLSVSAVPKSVSAQSYNVAKAATQKIQTGLSRSPIPVQPKTLFVEPGSNEGTAGTISGNNNIEAWVNGGYFEISVPSEENVTYPMRLTLELNNAEWYFRNDLGLKVIKGGKIEDNVYTPESGAYKLELSRTNLSQATLIIPGSENKKLIKETVDIKAIVNDINSILSDIRKNSGEDSGLIQKLLKIKTVLNKESLRNDKTEGNIADAVKDGKTEQYNKLLDAAKKVNKLSSNVNVSSVRDLKSLAKEGTTEQEGSLLKLKNAIIDLKNIDYSNLAEILKNNKHELECNGVKLSDIQESISKICDEGQKGLNKQIQIIKDLKDNPDKPDKPDNPDSKITVYKVPIVARSLVEGQDSSIRLLSSTSLPIESERRTFAIGTQSGMTTTVVRRPITARTNFALEAIGIRENRINALKTQGAFELVAPAGYEFRFTNPSLRTEGGIGGINGNFVIRHRTTTNNNINDVDYSIVQVIYSGLSPSTDMAGALSITGLSLIDLNSETVKEKDIYVNIRNLTGDFTLPNNKNVSITGNTITPERFLAGYARDWRVSLTTVDAIPTLVNGRLEGKEIQDVNDNDHKAATVRFEEQVKNAWWAERVTKLTLPQGVKIRKATFDRIRNINESDLNGTYYNNKNIGTGTGRVKIDDNVIILSGLTSKGEKASFDLNLWLTMESGFTGNIDLKLSGSGVTDNDKMEDKGIVIAKVINPVEVKAELTDAKIGYQYFTVGNFTITETAAGRLKSNKDVYVSITDNYSAAMQIAPGFKWEVTQGDLKVKNMTTGTQTQLGNLVNNKMTGAHITFTIDRESSKASQIAFRDVQVRLNSNYNSVSNDFNLVVWGPAIANNYKGLIEYNKNNNATNNNININDYFSKAGIEVPYIKSVGSGTLGENSNIFKNIVKVTVGNPTILVNNKEVIMPTAAYISPLSNSTMVPVRFISTGLGIDESKIIWDSKTGTITIDAGSRIIQMATNSDVIKINGAEIPMLSPDGLRVRVEIKDDRAFVPFRVLGEAFGIPVGWNTATATATYNDNSDRVINVKDNNIINKNI